MAIGLRQHLKLTQQLIMTPQLQMSIKLLQLSRLELIETVRKELEENPTLEEATDGSTGDTTEESANLTSTNSETVEGDSSTEKIHEDIDWKNYIDEYNTPARINFEAENRESTSFEAFTASKTSLSDHLLWQLLMISSTPAEKQIGSLIVGNLNKDGYLDISIEELCRLSGAEPEDVDRVLTYMQTFDPVGVCARNLKECLLIQLKHVGLDQTVAAEIIENHLNHLENKNYKAIARALKVSLDDVISAVNIIKTLEPKPARQFTDQEPQYITPDIYVYKFEDDYVIMLNDGGTPTLRISALYKKAMNGNGKFSGSDKE